MTKGHVSLYNMTMYPAGTAPVAGASLSVSTMFHEVDAVRRRPHTEDRIPIRRLPKVCLLGLPRYREVLGSPLAMVETGNLTRSVFAPSVFFEQTLSFPFILLYYFLSHILFYQPSFSPSSIPIVR